MRPTTSHFRPCALALCLLWGGGLRGAPAGAAIAAPTATKNRTTTAGMALIPAGTYTPLFKSPQDSAQTPVAAYYLDILPVTNRNYLAFVRANPKWRRSRVSPLFADASYLGNWTGDLDPGIRAPADAPVVNVSWFAVRAYARWLGKRLPTTAEWERAAAVGYTRPDGKHDAEFKRDIYRWFAAANPAILPTVTDARPNYLGVRGMFGYVWEWVEDFNTALVNGNADIDRKLVCSAGSVGSADPSDYAAFMRIALRSSLRANNTTSSLGFRCARNSSP